jgi:hypothetical protein
MVSATAYPSPRRFWTRLLAAALLVTALPSTAGTLFRVEYEMKLAGITVGRVTRSLGLEEGVYHFRSDARPTGLMGAFINKTFHETGRWRLVDGRIRPLNYRYVERDGKHEVVKNDLRFDWAHRIVCDRARGDACWPLTDDSQDPASATFAVMAAAARQHPMLTIHSIGGRKPVMQHYREAGEGHFDDGGQRVKVEKFVQTDQQRITLHAWLAPSKAWLPVFIRQEVRDGADTTLSLVRVDSLDRQAMVRIWAE